MSAYGIEYLEDAMKNLGEMADYAVNACGMDANDFWELFIATGYAEKFGAGVPRVVSGFSGTELAQEVLRKAGKKEELPEPQIEFTCSREYWSGWILAYYQWYSGKKFKEIESNLPVQEVLQMYPALHEASEDKFAEVADRIIQKKEQGKNALKRFRKMAGYTQKELSEQSGVTLRSIQQYEQGKKKLQKASAETIQALARSLGCHMENLL